MTSAYPNIENSLKTFLFETKTSQKLSYESYSKNRSGSIRFGMSPDELLAIFTEEPKYEDWMGGNLNDSLLFHGIIFGFDKCNSYGPLPNSRLDNIQLLGREDVILWGKLINEWDKTALLRYLEANNIHYYIHYDVVESGCLQLNSLSLFFCFDEHGKIDTVEMW